jgi:hypothetical protein
MFYNFWNINPELFKITAGATGNPVNPAILISFFQAAADATGRNLCNLGKNMDTPFHGTG